MSQTDSQAVFGSNWPVDPVGVAPWARSLLCGVDTVRPRFRQRRGGRPGQVRWRGRPARRNQMRDGGLEDISKDSLVGAYYDLQLDVKKFPGF